MEDDMKTYGNSIITRRILPGVALIGLLATSQGSAQTSTSTALVLSGAGNTVTTFDVDAALSDLPGAETTTILFSGIGRDLVVAPGGATAYVVTQAPGTLVQIDVPTSTVTATSNEDMGSPSAVAIAPDGSTIYILDSAPRPDCAPNGTLLQVDASSLQSTAQLCVGLNPAAVAVSPNGQLIYVANAGDGTLTVVDLDGPEREPLELGAGSSPRALELSPDGASAFVSDFGNNTLLVVNTAQLEVDAAIAVGEGPLDATLTPDGDVLVANFVGESVSVVDLDAGVSVSEVNVGGSATAIARANDGSLLVTAAQGSAVGHVRIIDSSGLLHMDLLAAGRFPIAIAISEVVATPTSTSTFTPTETPTATAATPPTLSPTVRATPTQTPTSTKRRTGAPTFTPTPPIECETDSECPRGLSCSDGYCLTIPCDTDEDCPPGITCVDHLCVQVGTPTPPVFCQSDGDCDDGLACGQDGICFPKDTPTPTFPCSEDDDCPGPLLCSNDVCVDPATPTPTSSPLPICLVDDDCFCPGDTPVEVCDRCRAGVCVPPRPCESTTADLDCRGERETCPDGFCVCGGDCDLNGLVFGTEISTMLCQLGGTCGADQCVTADVNEDGEITGCDVTLAVLNLGLGCPGEGTPLTFAETRTSETRTLSIGSAEGNPGQILEIVVSLEGGSEVTTAQTDILIPTDLVEILTLIGPDGAVLPDCRIDDRLAGVFRAEIRLPQLPRTPEGQRRIRLALVDTTLPLPLDSFSEGPVLRCKFRIDPLAEAEALIPLMGDPTRTEMGDPAGQPFNSVVADGTIFVRGAPPCTDDLDCPGTICRDGECVPPQCEKSSDCRPGIEACIGKLCICAGDCNGDGRISPGERNMVANIASGRVGVDSCASADRDQGGYVTCGEELVADYNFRTGCALPSNAPVDACAIAGCSDQTCVCSFSAPCLRGDPCGCDSLECECSGSASCVGDCNGDGIVAINELIRGVAIALARQDVSDCATFDGDQDGVVRIGELFTGVNNALLGCPS